MLALIPARGGSRSIPRKNIRSLGGHPLIAYSIAAAVQSTRVTRVIVSTDDEEIADVARACGADVPFMRPASLAGDDTPDHPVFEHALRELEAREGFAPDVIVQLRPTSPFRPSGFVDRAVDVLDAHADADAVRAITPARQNPYKTWTIRADGVLEPLLATVPEGFNMPRQRLPATFWQTGHVDVVRRDTILAKRSMTGGTIRPVEIDPRYAVDLDTPADWAFAEYLMSGVSMDVVRPGPAKRSLPERVSLVVLDFDGVLTDNRVWTDGEGREAVAADRSDGLGLSVLRQHGVEVIVLSTEANPVVGARCRKLGLECLQGLPDKAAALASLLAARGVRPDETIYVGNDVNDLGCFPLVACAFAVGDAHETARRHADRVLTKAGGHGAVRELCDMLLARMEQRPNHGG